MALMVGHAMLQFLDCNACDGMDSDRCRSERIENIKRCFVVRSDLEPHAFSHLGP